MAGTMESYEDWLEQVKVALQSNKMRLNGWQSRWPFDFAADYQNGIGAEDAATRARQFWWEKFAKGKVACPKCHLEVRMDGLTKHINQLHPKRRKKSRKKGSSRSSRSVWTVPGGLPDSKRSRH